VKVPVIVAGYKLDLRDEHNSWSFEHVVAPLMQQYKEIETCIECSAANLAQVYEVFYCAQKAVLHPIAPLFDQESQRLSRQYIRAMERIFILYDHDMDGALNDRELNEFQVKCFSRPLQSSEIVGFKIIVWERVLEGVNEYGITLENINVPSRKDPDQEQMKNYKAPNHGSASVEVMESLKAAIEYEKIKLAKIRKEIEEDHEHKKLELAKEHEKHKAELDAMRKEFDDHWDKLVEDAMRKLIEKNTS
ncbi:mitochondrial Rho GTPase 2-like protein, partial [Tanacetum coccineum]